MKAVIHGPQSDVNALLSFNLLQEKYKQSTRYFTTVLFSY